ncbi:MAG TPA: hypothetical protein VFZ09_31240 [Archangium sp.]|uniref:hypothetical protein n=1 Tax=Archangium sp. TaxID=1872627 RepID=UPI002E3456BC|nr:hypothetical protein [Archangium sp.]HEX5750742.1 hypothetical protein [Archangium sp.]
MDALLDTSSLSAAIDNDKAVAAFTGLVRRSKMRFLIAREALDEAFAGVSGEKLVQKALRLERLFASLGSAIDVAELGNVICMLEAKGRIASTPLLNIQERKEIARELAVIKAGGSALSVLKKASTRVGEYKAETRDVWKGAIEEGMQKYRAKKWSARELGESLLNFGPEHIDTTVLMGVLTQSMGLPPTECVWVLRRTERYKSLRAYLAMAQVLILGSSVPADLISQHPLLRRLKYHPNHHMDMMIASSAAYADFFVTEDKNLTELCRFLRNRGCLGFRSCSLSALEYHIR